MILLRIRGMISEFVVVFCLLLVNQTSAAYVMTDNIAWLYNDIRLSKEMPQVALEQRTRLLRIYFLGILSVETNPVWSLALRQDISFLILL